MHFTTQNFQFRLVSLIERSQLSVQCIEQFNPPSYFNNNINNYKWHAYIHTHRHTRNPEFPLIFIQFKGIAGLLMTRYLCQEFPSVAKRNACTQRRRRSIRTRSGNKSNKSRWLIWIKSGSDEEHRGTRKRSWRIHQPGARSGTPRLDCSRPRNSHTSPKRCQPVIFTTAAVPKTDGLDVQVPRIWLHNPVTFPPAGLFKQKTNVFCLESQYIFLYTHV